MSERLEVDQTRIIAAVELVSHTMEDAGFSKIEAACAFKAMLQAFAEEGLDVRIEHRLQS